MVDDSENSKTPTRRGCLKYGGTIAGSGLFTSCSSTSEPSSSSPKPHMSSTQTAVSETVSETDTATGSDESCAVTVKPMGEVAFNSLPERWTTLLPTFADMAFALGGRQTLGIRNHDHFASKAFGELPGIDFDTNDTVELVVDSVSRELFYEMNAGVHFINPHILRPWYGWDQSDIDEIADSVGPFFGNFTRHHSDD